MRSRDLWIILRGRDEASRVFRSFGRNVNASTRGAVANMSQFDQSLQRTGMRLTQFGVAAQLAGAVITGMGIAGLAFLRSTIDVAAEYDRQARRTLTQVDGIKASLEDVAEVGRRVAREIGVPFETLQDTLFFIFSSMDVSVKESETLLRGFAKEAVAGQTDIEAAARTTIAIMNALQIPVSDLTRLQDIQFQVVRKGIISYEELSKTIGRALPATSRAGQSFETLGAMIAFMTRNGLSAAMASTSAARALEAFAHPTTVGRIEEMGIKVRDARGEFLPLVDVLGALTKEMRGMGSVERSEFMQELFKGSGGRIQARRFFDLAFANFKQFDTMVGHMENSAGAFDNAYGIMVGSVSTQSELLRNRWMLIKEALGRALLPAFRQLLDMFGKVLEWFDRLPQPVKAVIAQFILWSSIAAILVGAFLVLAGSLAFLIGGIMLAGKALVIFVIVSSALIAAIIGLAAVFILAWKNSETFRDIIRSVIDLLKQYWRIAVDTAQGIKAAFEKNLLPALQKVWNGVNTKLLPIIQRLWGVFYANILPVVRQVADFLQQGLAIAFIYVGKVIDSVVVPAIERLQGWYEKNQDTVHQVIRVVTQIAKAFMILAAIIIIVLVVAFGTMIAIIAAVVFAFIQVHRAVMAVGNFLRELGTTIVEWVLRTAEMFRGWGANIVQFFVNAWNLIVQFAQLALATVAGVIMAGVNFILANVWEPFWNTFGGVFKAVWELILALINFFTVLIAEIIKDWLIPLGEFFKKIWNGIVNFFKGVWASIVERFTSGTNRAKEIWQTVWNAVSGFTSRIWNSIKNAISAAINFVKNNIIRPVTNAIKSIWDDHLSGLWNKAKEIWNKVKDAISNGIRTVKNLFIGAKNWLLQAGKNIIQGLIDGVTSMIGKFTDKLKNLTDLIPELKGPLQRDLRLLEPSGQAIMTGFMRGIDKKLPALFGQLQAITTKVGGFQPTVPLPGAGGGRPMSFDSPGSEEKVEQNITINTNEIDPVRHSEQLGFLLSARRG